MRRQIRPKQNSDQLASHSLAQKVQKDIRPLLRPDDSNEEMGGGQLSKSVLYADAVFPFISALVSAFDHLERSQHFIKSFPQPRQNEEQGIRQHDWIEYHYSYYLITFVSLLDVSLRLTNAVFYLGNRERDCKFDLITENSWVAQTSVTSVLKEIRKLVEPFKTERNKFVHCGETPKFESIMESKNLKMLDRLSFIEIHGKAVVNKKTLQLAYKRQVIEILNKLKAKSVFDEVSKLFNQLEPIYDSHIATLR
jgi:hypothetical protein